MRSIGFKHLKDVNNSKNTALRDIKIIRFRKVSKRLNDHPAASFPLILMVQTARHYRS